MILRPRCVQEIQSTQKVIMPYRNWRNEGYSGRFGKNGGGMIRPERKFFDTALASTTVSTTGTTMQGATTAELTAIINGTGENERNGSRIRLVGIHGRIQLNLPSIVNDTTLDATYGRIRIMIGIDKQSNGAHAAMTDILESAGVDAFRNIENIHRFLFLYDKNFIINTQASPDGATANLWDTHEKIRFFQINLRLNMPMYFDGTTGQKAEVRSHQIFMFAISQAGRIKMTNKWRVRYYG